MVETKATTEIHARRSWLGRLIIALAGRYGLGLALYLVLRLLLGDSLWWLALLNNFMPYYFVPPLVFIPLLLLIHARRMAVRLLPLLLIALWLYGPYWLPKSTGVADESQLKLVTFNIQLAIPDLDVIGDWLKSTEADVILLQELGPGNSIRIFDLLSDTYPYTVDLVGTTQSALSRLPIVDSERIDMGGWFGDRLVLDVEGESLAVYNIHMPVPYATDDPALQGEDVPILSIVQAYDETWRNTIIRNFLNRLNDETLPYIVAGDFNTSDNAVIYAELASRMRDSFREVGTGLGVSWPANGGWLPPLLRLDYVWHSEGLRALSAELGPRLGSDHLPLIVTFENLF